MRKQSYLLHFLLCGGLSCLETGKTTTRQSRWSVLADQGKRPRSKRHCSVPRAAGLQSPEDPESPVLPARPPSPSPPASPHARAAGRDPELPDAAACAWHLRKVRRAWAASGQRRLPSRDKMEAAQAWGPPSVQYVHSRWPWSAPPRSTPQWGSGDHGVRC